MQGPGISAFRYKYNQALSHTNLFHPLHAVPSSPSPSLSSSKLSPSVPAQSILTARQHNELLLLRLLFSPNPLEGGYISAIDNDGGKSEHVREIESSGDGMGEIRQAILQPENIHVLTQLVALSMLQELDLAKYTGNGDNDNANTDNSGSGPVETDSNTKEGSTSSTSANTGVAKQCNGDNDPLCLYDNHPRLPSLLADGQNLFSSLVSGNPLRASVLAQFIRKTWAHKGNNIVIFGAPMPNHVRRLARQAAVKSAYRAVLSCMFGVYPLRLSLYQWLAKQAFSLYIQLFKVNVVGPMMSQLNQTENHRSS